MRFLRESGWVKDVVKDDWECYHLSKSKDGFIVMYLLHLILEDNKLSKAAICEVVYGGPFGRIKSQPIWVGSIGEAKLEELLSVLT